MTIDLSAWKRRVPPHITADAADDDIFAAADKAEMLAIRARQAANRHAAYAKRLPARYASATYASLRPAQNPRGLVSGWWDHGPRTLILAGPPRTGKTTAAYAVANAAHAELRWVVAVTAGDLSARLKPDVDPCAYDHAIGCDLLIIDDLGREKITEWWVEQLGRIVDSRCANIKRVIVTTNTEPNPNAVFTSLADMYGDPIAERLIDGGGVIALDGPAIREVLTSW